MTASAQKKPKKNKAVSVQDLFLLIFGKKLPLNLITSIICFLHPFDAYQYKLKTGCMVKCDLELQ